MSESVYLCVAVLWYGYGLWARVDGFRGILNSNSSIFLTAAKVNPIFKKSIELDIQKLETCFFMYVDLLVCRGTSIASESRKTKVCQQIFQHAQQRIKRCTKPSVHPNVLDPRKEWASFPFHPLVWAIAKECGNSYMIWQHPMPMKNWYGCAG